MKQTHTLLPEWAEQEAIILAWPDDRTDWKPWLASVRQTYKQLISAISANNTAVILLIRDGQIESAKQLLAGIAKVLLIRADYNDTWCRDYAFLTCNGEDGLHPIEFQFNGWGQKFDANTDNQVNQTVLAPLCRNPLTSFSLVAEGGALEIDQNGHLLSTELCLTNPLRNGTLSLSGYEEQFKQILGATQVSILGKGHLEGDDTDGHIDTLARYTPTQGLVIQSCFNRPDDSHFVGLSDLVAECRHALPNHTIFELPLPHIVSEDGERLPASYANYLINNQQILCPIYQQPEDDLALTIIQQAYPDYTIVAIDSLPLVQQFGSVHCISMQVPKGTLLPEVLSQVAQHPVIFA
ncbi:agmatine deiminase family protein [Aliiglaciecola sp. LCG003]|uniref:agmatine deiminase family protein n=1 Tax=Aliiglaciecola sp. LCG003 TaxID=3053655 RepID=UPI002574482F|nr:agmatine deiminase family protein [Aliiglaciecola sp. LCG003]WJG09813.1 agmatine deiminase family protein [Aliiglaciecola sp. LCG003]